VTSSDIDRVNNQQLERRVVEVAEAALAEKLFVSPIDVLMGISWLPPSHVDRWRQGRVPCLENAVSTNLSKLSTAMGVLRRWAVHRGLTPRETGYVTSTRDRRPLRFSVSGKDAIERAYRTHWVSPELGEKKRERLAERQSRPPDLVAIQALNDWTCSLCEGRGGDLLLMEQTGPVCLTCADMDHLVFLAAGDATLSRRAKKASGLSAVVVRFSRARKRYERQGILVEEAALERAERECLDDHEARAHQRVVARAGREREDVAFQRQLALEIERLFPGCPSSRAHAIATHAGARSSGRVGRTAAARALDAEAVTLAVVASVRHEDTPYDDLLMSGLPRAEARQRVWPDVERVLQGWRSP
jgi:hypothetical protein